MPVIPTRARRGFLNPAVEKINGAVTEDLVRDIGVTHSDISGFGTLQHR
jgi:hypothetical protein